MEWKSYGDHGRVADGKQGKWRIVTDGEWWFLTVQTEARRGMKFHGKFLLRRDAESWAAERDSDEPILPQQIGLS